MNQHERLNLKHVLMEGPCTDPDCELHNPNVGLEEETVDLTQVAFFLAGVTRGLEAAHSMGFLNAMQASDAELKVLENYRRIL